MSQEVVTAAVLDTLSNPDVICRLLALYDRYIAFLLATGASPLGDMPNASEVASLGLPLAPGSGGEDPLTAVAGSASSSSRRDPCKVVSSGATHSSPVDHFGGAAYWILSRSWLSTYSSKASDQDSKVGVRQYGQAAT